MRILKTVFLTLLVFAGASKMVAAPTTNDDYKRVAVVLVLDEDDDDDERTVTTVFTTLMAAEKIAKMLDVELNVSNDPIADDVFVFSLKTKEQEQLAFKLLDEEGFEKADNTMLVDEGNNYKSLNVQSLPDGTYKFIVRDDQGAEITRDIVIERGRATNKN